MELYGKQIHIRPDAKGRRVLQPDLGRSPSGALLETPNAKSQKTRMEAGWA